MHIISLVSDFTKTYWQRIILLGTLLALMLGWHYYIQPWMLDDAFISFRYAENWANGLGPVYNAGERVEGYTTFLWVSLLAVTKIIGLETVVVAKIVGYLTAIGTLVLLMFLDKIIPYVDSKIAIIATIFVGTSGIFLPWAISGMETALFTFLLLLTVVCYLKSFNNTTRRHLGVTSGCLTLLSLTRPEGVIVAGILFLHYVIVKRTHWQILILPYFVLYGSYFLWRMYYYQSFFPNTYYAKSGDTLVHLVRGLRYMNRFVLAASSILIPSLLWLMDRSFDRAKSLRVPLLGILVGTYGAFVVYVGGDIMPAFRFFVPILPILGIISASAIVTIFTNKKLIMLTTLCVVAGNMIQLLTHQELNQNFFQDTVAADGKIVGQWLKENMPKDTVIAVNTAGTIPYYSGLKTIDMLGLTNSHIAKTSSGQLDLWFAGHAKGDGNYVLSQKPDVIIFRSSLGAKEPYFKSDRELFSLKEFHSNYSYQETMLNEDSTLKMYVRKNNITIR